MIEKSMIFVGFSRTVPTESVGDTRENFRTVGVPGWTTGANIIRWEEVEIDSFDDK